MGEGGVDVELIEEDEGLSVELLVHHHSENTHLGRAAVVELPGPQVDHVLLAPREGSESDGERGGAEVSGEGSRLLLPGELQKSGSEEDGDQVLNANLEHAL